MEADSVLHQSAPIHAVYFGGGTPSALSAHDLARIITTLREKLPLAPDCEITIEGRVLNFDAERIDACLDAGANRFSIGIQSFNSKIRKKMARTSDGPTAIAFMESSWSNATVPRWSVTCCLVCRVRMRKPGRRSGYCPRYRSRRRRSLCAQCPAQYTAGQSRGKWAYYRALSGRTSRSLPARV